MARKRAVDDVALSGKPQIVDAGAAAGPALTAAAEQGGRDRRSRGGVADAHFAEAEEIALRLDGVIARGDGGAEFGLAERGRRREIGGGGFERKRNDAQRGAGRAGELVDGRAACGKIRHHLHGDLGRIGGDALGGDAVIAGEHQHLGALKPRRRVALPMGEEGYELLQPPEAFRRLGQRVLAHGDGIAGGGMAARQVETDGAQIGKGGEGGHGRGPTNAIRSSPRRRGPSCVHQPLDSRRGGNERNFGSHGA